MEPARNKARNEWYATLREENRGLWYDCQKKESEVTLEQRALPKSERLTRTQICDIVDAMTTIKDDPEFYKRVEELRAEFSAKASLAAKKKRRAKKAEESKGDTPSNGPRVDAAMVSASASETSPGGELPPPGDVGVVGNPRDILWAVEYLGNDTVDRGDAPSGTAWTLLCAGRKSPDTLLRIYQGVCVPSKKELEDAADETEAFDHLDDVLKRVIEIAEAAVA
tara:strand:- start:3032 stop:3703 length:672 start_codon:yes stop_codon:yes gene_type:complete